jgi:uncharacterized DUF497 family protein
MSVLRILWDDERDPEGNVQHLLEHDLTIDDVEHVLGNPTGVGSSISTGLPVVWGYTPDRRYVIVVFERIGDDWIRVITAYDVPNPA